METALVQAYFLAAVDSKSHLVGRQNKWLKETYSLLQWEAMAICSVGYASCIS